MNASSVDLLQAFLLNPTRCASSAFYNLLAETLKQFRWVLACGLFGGAETLRLFGRVSAHRTVTACFLSATH